MSQFLPDTGRWVRVRVNIGPAKSRNPRNPPHISRNPHPKKRNPTPAAKSTATPPKANYRNPPALNGVCLRMALLRCHVQSSTLHSERWHTSKSIRLALIIAYYPSHRRLIQPGR